MNAPQREDLSAQQHAFAAYLRDPERYPPPEDVAHGRMAVYRELFFHNVCATLDDAFPVARSLIPNTHWRDLLARFFAGHRGRTPFLARLPGEFAAWYAGCAPTGLPIWLAELLRHEWLLLERALDPAPVPMWGGVTDPLAATPRLSPLARLEAYDYPVHLIGPDFRPEAPGPEPTRLARWRDRHHRVRALVLNPASARLLELAANDRYRSGQQLLEQIAQELRHPAPPIVIAGGVELLTSLYRRDLLIGSEGTP